MQKTLQLSEEIAKKLYETASPEFKAVLEESFGKELFTTDIEELVSAAYRTLRIEAKKMRGDWTPDWTDSSQAKYVPWFEYKSGVGFSLGDYVSWSASTFVGSRLCFPSEKMAKEFAKKFIKEYNIILSN